MKNIIIGLLLLVTYTISGQDLKVRAVADRDWKTPEQALSIPNGYIVLSCDIVVADKQSVMKVSYSHLLCKPQNCVNADQQKFDVLWRRMLDMVRAGNEITLDNIKVKKGDREMKWLSKSFVLP
jgi:hypothetical protein